MLFSQQTGGWKQDLHGVFQSVHKSFKVYTSNFDLWIHWENVNENHAANIDEVKIVHSFVDKLVKLSLRVSYNSLCFAWLFNNAIHAYWKGFKNIFSHGDRVFYFTRLIIMQKCKNSWAHWNKNIVLMKVKGLRSCLFPLSFRRKRQNKK